MKILKHQKTKETEVIELSPFLIVFCGIINMKKYLSTKLPSSKNFGQNDIIKQKAKVLFLNRIIRFAKSSGK